MNSFQGLRNPRIALLLLPWALPRRDLAAEVAQGEEAEEGSVGPLRLLDRPLEGCLGTR